MSTNYTSENRISISITHCAHCPSHIHRAIYTADSFDHESGIYCGLVPDDTDSWVRHTMGEGPTNFRVVATSEWDVEAAAEIPDWCPHVLNQLEYVCSCLSEHHYVKQAFDELWHSDSPLSYGRAHSVHMAKLGTMFLTEYHKKFGTGSLEKDAKLLQIAALLHELGRTSNARNVPLESAHTAEWLLRDFYNLSLSDRQIIIGAILHHADGKAISHPVEAALYFAENLNFAFHRFEEVNSSDLDDFEEQVIGKSKSPKFDEQCFRTGSVSFTTETRAEKTPENPWPRPDTGVLTISHNMNRFGIVKRTMFDAELFHDGHSGMIENARNIAKKFLKLKTFEIRVEEIDFYEKANSFTTVLPFSKFMPVKPAKKSAKSAEKDASSVDKPTE